MYVQPFRRWVMAAIAGLMVWGSPGMAEVGAVKLGVVDTEQVLLQSLAGKKALAPLNDLVKATQAEAARMHAEIQQVRDQAIQLTKSPGAANQDALAALQQKFSKQIAELQRYETEARQKIEKQRYETLVEFSKLVMPVIQMLGKEQGYAMVFRKQDNAVLYSDVGNDLTPLVIQRLESQPGGK